MTKPTREDSSAAIDATRVLLDLQSQFNLFPQSYVRIIDHMRNQLIIRDIIKNEFVAGRTNLSLDTVNSKEDHDAVANLLDHYETRRAL